MEVGGRTRAIPTRPAGRSLRSDANLHLRDIPPLSKTRDRLTFCFPPPAPYCSSAGSAGPEELKPEVRE